MSGRSPWLAGGPDIDTSPVMRLVRISVSSTIAGALPTTVVAIPGGTIGCATFQTDLVPHDFGPGYEGLFFVGQDGPRTGLTGVLVVSEVWPIADGRIRLPGGGELTLAQAKESLSG